MTSHSYRQPATSGPPETRRVELDQRQAAQLIAAQLVPLRGLSVRRVAEGQDHQLFAAGEEWLVRFPKRAEGASWLERELSILKVVTETVTAGVPKPELTAPPSDAFPYPFITYRRIPGIGADLTSVSDPVGLAADIGRLLDALHRVDPDRISPTPVGWERLTLEHERTNLLSCADAAARLLTPDLAGRAEAYLTGAAPVPARQFPRRFIHNDICPDHLIVDPTTGRLNGIIDFTDAMVGDPVLDFVGLVGLGGQPFIDQVLANYALALGHGFDQTLQWLTRTLTLRWLAEAATDNPPAIVKHLRWVTRAFGLED